MQGVSSVLLILDGGLGGMLWRSVPRTLLGFQVSGNISQIIPEFYWELVMKFLF